MDLVPSILLLSWNRREYFERTIAHLLADSADFRLYMWDNGSADGVADLIRALDDPRIAERHYSPDNVGQAIPWRWFVENSRGDIAGKLDDDILGEPGWMARFAGLIAAEPKFGTLGAWVFMPEDWDEALSAHKIETIGGTRIFRNPWVPGGIFLGRREVLQRYTKTDPAMLGIPLDQNAMCRDGYVNGFPLPLSLAQHIDDPRHPLCRMNRPGGWDQFAAYTARMRGFTGPAEYGRWIAADARAMQQATIREQLDLLAPGPITRLRRRIGRGLKRLGLAAQS